MSHTSSDKPSITRTILQAIPVPELPGWESRLVLIEYPPGAAAPLHNHPVAGTGYVLEGEVVSQFQGGELERYHAGQSFTDAAVLLHRRAENGSATAPLKFLMSYVIQKGQPAVISE